MKQSIFFTILALILTLGPLGPSAAEKQQDPNQLFYSANAYYAKRDYAKATEEYLKILDMGLESANLYYNIGNSFFKSGKFGYAILYYERAKRLTPQDGDLKSNLAYAKTMAGAGEEEFERRVVDIITAPFKDISLGALAITAAIFYGLLVSMAALWILAPYIFRRLAAAFLLVAAIFMLNLTALVIRYHDEDILTRGIIVQKQAEIKYEPIDTSTTYYTLPEGANVVILKTRDSWRQIVPSGGKFGWVKEEAVEKI